MSTNFYLTRSCPHPCEHCQAGEPIHLGLRYGSGRGKVSFTLQAFDEHSVMGPVKDWATWRRILRSPEAGVVRDEYGTAYEVEEFISMVESSHRPRSATPFDVIDDEGYLLCLSDFS